MGKLKTGHCAYCGKLVGRHGKGNRMIIRIGKESKSTSLIVKITRLLSYIPWDQAKKKEEDKDKQRETITDKTYDLRPVLLIHKICPK